MRKLLTLFGLFALATTSHAINYTPETVSARLSLKIPGNQAKHYPLTLQPSENGNFTYQLVADKTLPVMIYQQVTGDAATKQVKVVLVALEDVYFHYGQTVKTGTKHDNCQFYLPGFWYRRNLRSPEGAPSFRVSDSWTVREDRLSTPLTAIYDDASKKTMSVIRLEKKSADALTTHKEGEVILSGKTSLGYTGFCNESGSAALAFGFPYQETPRTYIRKLTLAPAVEAYQSLKKGETLTLVWELNEQPVADFSDCVKKNWEYSYDKYLPAPVEGVYTPEQMKETMSNFFVESFVGDYPVKYYSGCEMAVATCENRPVAEVGFIGRTLLNAFNALEYGESQNRADLVKNANAVFDSYLQHGISEAGFFHERMYFPKGDGEWCHSIRRQSEGIYATLYYLDYEKRQGRKHPEWEKRIRTMLELFLKLQKEDGSFPRKFKDDMSIVDGTGGSTPSATLPLVMGYKYFKDKRFLQAAKKSVDYLERELISKADYFSSTLDANCEDKEASLYGTTAAYYMALVSKGEEQKHYADLALKATYFALSWYYTWDVPFAEGQMLGDAGLKSRGWGNVSVENNHIDVYIFDFVDVLKWLAEQYDEPRFTRFADVITTSMCQLIPDTDHMCGIAKKGYYPEVVQHTNWDYGKNGKGYYNDIFAPGWVVASLWELFSPGRAESFLLKR